MNNIFLCLKRYFTHPLCSLVKCCPFQFLISSIYYSSGKYDFHHSNKLKITTSAEATLPLPNRNEVNLKVRKKNCLESGRELFIYIIFTGSVKPGHKKRILVKQYKHK